MFVLKVVEPTALDAVRDTQDNSPEHRRYKLRMFEGRPHSIVQLLILEKDGKVVNQVAVRVTKSGNFRLDNLNTELV